MMFSRKALLLTLLFLSAIIVSPSYTSAKSKILVLGHYNSSLSFEVNISVDSTFLKTGDNQLNIKLITKQIYVSDTFITRSDIFVTINLKGCIGNKVYYSKEINNIPGWERTISYEYNRNWGQVCLFIELRWTEFHTEWPQQRTITTGERKFFALWPNTLLPDYGYIILGIAIMGSLTSFIIYKKKKK
ncbi:MAG: hypothetical protein GPJ51_13245 [Candidatus Heimdallarchaeota archaeon]|nr:hypothetical protein [Candidatus Heimdallarchaeota archaeon]